MKELLVALLSIQVAAQILDEDLGIGAENEVKWLHDFHITGATFAPSQLVVIDEASWAGIFTFDQITAQAEQQETKVLIVGEWVQLQSVDAGGVFAMLVSARDNSSELTDVHRFIRSWEKTNSLDPRHGDAHRPSTRSISHSCVFGDEEERVPRTSSGEAT